MLKSKEVLITLCSKNIDYYKNKNYDTDSLKVERKWGFSIPRGTKLLVKVEDLPPFSHVEIEVECDYCGIEFTKLYSDYTTSNPNGIINKDCCDKNECLVLKRNESNLVTYGCENVFQVEEFKEKIKDINLDRYGCEYVSQNEDIKNKMKQTCLDLYGVENYTQTEEYKERYITTCQEKYGCDNANKSEEIKEKIKQTVINKYGVDNVMHVEEFKDKAITNMQKSKYKNNTGLYSSQQLYLNNLLNGELNFAVGRCLLDVAFIEENIYIEYDGGFHDGSVKLKQMSQEHFNLREINRYYYLKKFGWNIIKIISIKDYLPSDEIILNMIDYAKNYLNTNHSWISFDIDNSKIINSQGKFDYDFGELRKIPKIKEEISNV